MSVQVQRNSSVHSIHGESLLNRSVLSVIDHLSLLIDNVTVLPTNLKLRILRLMQKRGLLTDLNIAKVVCDGVVKLDLSESELSDAALLVIASLCPRLKGIDLNAAKNDRTTITSLGVKQLAESCKFLQVIYLRRCVNVGDEALIAVAQNCRLLHDLNIGGCRLVTDASLHALGQHSASLSSIDFSRCAVTDNGVLSLVQGVCATSLKEVHMDGCRQLTDDSVEAVTMFCPNVNILIFHGCPNITDRSRVALESVLGAGNSPIKQLTWTVY